MPARAMVDVRKPRMEGSDISPTYMGNAVYRAPSAAPMMNLNPVMTQIDSANAIPMQEKNTTGAIRSVVNFLPILSASIAAIMAPGGAPNKGATAHHDPSSFVVGM